ncbi:MAG TPA: asparagine synthase (glutamine-hydrolyzing) [Polyangiaceae bacterium]|nr:asparagine synthase (glutamine-hydrolyzing) [Polyangiaceae bacterium]
MCGLTGFWGPEAGLTEEELSNLVRNMAGAIVHRGPDAAGEWSEPAAGYAVGFRRLSIIDLSPAGRQPMISGSGRYVIAFNGEVYNFEAIRRELTESGVSVNYRGHSDTEVMLAAIDAWGLHAAVRRFIGMFAFALWDRRERVLHLVRDRLGVKPLYYGCPQGTLLFGSELKPLRKHPNFRGAVNRGALALYLRHAYVPAPHTIFEGYFKLPPASILSIADPRRPLPAPEPYWSAREVACAGIKDPLLQDEAELTERLDRLLRDAVGLRLISDVPLGVFLSGGIDSSVVAAIAQAASSRPARTFSIGFSEPAYDEAPHAKRVAQHLGTEHTELYVTPRDALDVVPKLPALYDEPFADSSQIPTYLVSAMARKHVTVCLSGDGGDELFAGYNRYNHAAQLWRWVGPVPARARRLVAKALRALAPRSWDRALSTARPYLPHRLRMEHPADKVAKVAGILELAELDQVYRHLVSAWRDPTNVAIGSAEPETLLTRADQPPIADATLRMMYFDLVTYLPDDILVKVDRASMGVSLEAREPLLDHRLVEFAWRLPMAMKSRHGVGKWLLRRVLDRYVPRDLVERPKTGFGLPIDSWLRGPLREWANALLDRRRLEAGGFFRPEPIQEAWARHQSGRSQEHHRLWAVLMFQAWLEQNGRAQT